MLSDTVTPFFKRGGGNLGGNRMKINKKLIIGSVILILITTPLLAAGQIQNDDKPNQLNSAYNNSLGKFTIQHQPFFPSPGLIGLKGMEIIDYIPPEDYIYEFPEDENGTVWMNFTLTIEHWINDIIFYPSSWIFGENFRHTWVKNLYINYEEYDYISHEEYIDVNKTKDIRYVKVKALEGLITNGENKTVDWYQFGLAGIGPFGIDIFVPLLLQNWLMETEGKERQPLTIVPI